MAFTKLPERGRTRDIVDTFRGYNHNLRPADGEAYEMHNMCSDHYPVAATRSARGSLGTYPECGGIICKDRLWWVDGSALTNGEDTVELGLAAVVPYKPKQLVSMGAYIIVLPDRKYLNTADLTDFGDIDASFSTGTEVRVYLCRANGEDWSEEYVGPDEPENPADAAVWVKTSEYPNKLMQWSETAQVWTQVAVTTVRILASGIGEGFGAGDGVVLSGFDSQLNYTDFETGEPLNEDQIEQLKALDGGNVVVERDKDWIVVNGIVDAKVALAGVITIKRELPIMDYVVEHKIRLWGCRYGLDAGGEFVNIVYASKLGDFRNWQCYQGIESDSYYANIGSDGPFTGAISYGDSVVFSKENGLHLVYGDGPGSFQIQRIDAPGVQRGSGASMAIVGGVVYYKSVRGVCAFDGSLPVDVGYCLGGVAYTDAVGGAYGAKYYVSMVDRGKKAHLFVYDTEKKLWHREDDLRACAFAYGSGEAYMLTADGEIVTMGAGDVAEAPFDWHWQSGVIGAEGPDRKRLMNINVRLSLAVGARMRVLVRYDSAGQWVKAGELVSQRLRAVNLPVRIQRCDHLEIRFEGRGPCQIHSFVKTYTEGSDRR